MIQRTLVLLKPDAVARGLVGEIVRRFERVGLRMVGLKLRQASEEQARRHYAELATKYGPPVLEKNVRMLLSGPVVAMVLEGDEAVAVVRKMVGDTYPHLAAPGTIRGDFCHVSKEQAIASGQAVLNVIHASAKPEEAPVEVDLWFSADELVSHVPAYAATTVYGPGSGG